MTSPTGSLTSLRLRNRLQVLKTVQERPSVSRVEISRLTGLSRTTVSSLVAELLAESLLVELPERANAGTSVVGGGRPPISLALHPDIGAVVGVHLRHDGVRVVLTDLNATILAEDKLDSEVGTPEDSLSYAAGTARRLLAEAGVAQGKAVAMGVAVSAPVELGSHSLSLPSVMRGWDDIDIADVLHGLTGLPTFVGNDANLGAIAEWRFGAGRGVDDLVYVMLSDGVGAGMVLGGRLYEGASGAAGELGHVTVAVDGHICRCGNRGCLETVAGSRALVDALSHSRGPGTGLSDVLSLAASEDPGACRAINDAGRAVGHALAGIVTMLDPRMVVIGGKVAAAGTLLVDGIRDVLARSLPPVTNRGLRVVAGQLGERAEVLGATAIAGQHAVGHLPT